MSDNSTGANPGSDVKTASSTVDEYSFLSDDGNLAGVSENSPNSDAQVEQALDAGSDPVTPEATEQVTAETDNKVKKQDNPGFKRRIDKLTSKLKTVEESSRNAEREAERYKKAFELLKEQFEAKQARLMELEEIDPVKAENEKLKFERRIMSEQSRLDEQWKARVAQAEKEARVSTMAEQMLEDIESATTKYPTVSTVELAVAIKKQPTANIEALAKELHEQRYKALENEFTAKYKNRVNPPKPVTPTGSSYRRDLRNDDEMAAELDAMLGPDWNKRNI